MQKSRTSYVIKNTGAGIVVKVISILMAFILKTVFIKVLGIQYTGVSSLFTDVLTILSFAELGIGSAITYALYKPVADDDIIQIAKLMNFYKMAYRFVTFTVLTIGIIFIPFLDLLVNGVPDIKEDIRLIYVLYLINTSCSYLLIYKSSILVAKQKKYVVSLYEGFFSVIRMIIGVFNIVFTRNFVAYLVVDIILTVLQNYAISRISDREYQENKSLRLSKAERSIIFADIGALAMYQISGVVLAGTDSIVISSMLGTSLVGYLSYYKLLSNGITSICQQFFTGANASVGNLAVEGDREKQYELFKELNFGIFWISVFCASAMFLLLNPFIELWLGKKYVMSQYIAMFIALDFYVTNMVRVVALFRTSNGLFVYGKYRPIVMSIINVILSVVFGYLWGVEGVLAATVISRVATQSWYDSNLIYRKVFKKNYFEYLVKYILFLATLGLCVTLEWWICNCFFKTSFVTKFFVAVLVPNIVIPILWGQSQSFKMFFIRVKGMVKCKTKVKKS